MGWKEGVGAFCLVWAGCGRLGFGADAPEDMDGSAQKDATPDARSDGEGGAPGTPCTGAWETPVRIEPLVHAGPDDDPSFTADLLELFFVSARPGGAGSANLWVSTRAEVTDPWGAPEVVPDFGPVNTPHVAADGLSLWYTRSSGGAGEDIYFVTRATRSSPWGAPTLVEELSVPNYFEKAPAPHGDLLRIMFASDRPGGDGDLDFYRARRSSVDEPWTDIEWLATVSTPYFETRPWPLNTGRRIYFHSIRGNGSTEADIYVADFNEESLEYEEAVLLEALSSPRYDEDVAVSDDECYAVLSTERDEENNQDIYEVFRAP